MALYINYSTRIYNIYLRYVSPDDIHVYSIDEVFMDVTRYLELYKITAHELATRIIHSVLEETGVTATAGIGSNLYLAKVAMDIVAKHIPADKYGVRIAELDERSYREKLWNHRPLTDFWRVGRGIARRLENKNIYTMGMLARSSLHEEEMLYKMFGVNAELLIDHAWGWEPCTIKHIKKYRPESNSLSSGQVLKSGYSVAKARIVVSEMADNIALNLVEKHLVANQVGLVICYDVESLNNPVVRSRYRGKVGVDYYGRTAPVPVNGIAKMDFYTSSSRLITNAILEIFDRIVNTDLLVRRININILNVVPESEKQDDNYVQLELFSESSPKNHKKERLLQETMLEIKKKYGKNAILKGLSFEEGATARGRNSQIGGHKA